MKDKHIKILTMLGLVTILALQIVWLVSTYRLTREELTHRNEEVFKDAMMTEVLFRTKKLEASNVKYQMNAELDEVEFETQGKADELLMSAVRLAMQDGLQNEYNLPLSLSRLDSIYAEQLKAAGLPVAAYCCLTDSLGNVLESFASGAHSSAGSVQTAVYPITYDKTKNVQGFIVNPYRAIFQRMALLLVATALMMIFVAYCIVYQIRIITRQNKIARLREDFSYAMIHDMKTPLSSILMGTQILETGKLDAQPEKRAKYFHILKDEGEHLLALTNKVLTLSKLENHQLKLSKEDTALRPMLEDLREKFTAKAGKPVRFSLQLETEMVYADEEFLKEALSNLIDNSIKYSGESVNICVSSRLNADGWSTIRVKDNGFGIPLKDQSRIFEKYERASAADRSRKGGASGFGLGLNYVFRVTEAHGGKVDVESIEGEYSEFSISIPGKTDF